MLIVVGFFVRGYVSRQNGYYYDPFSMVFSVGEPDQQVSRRDITRKAMAYMGFDADKDEYTHAYPALTVQNAAVDYEDVVYGAEVLRPDYIWYYPSISIRYYTGRPQGYFKLCLDHIICQAIESQSLYAVPTLAELEPYAGIENVVATEPWFCEDWKEFCT